MQTFYFKIDNNDNLDNIDNLDNNDNLDYNDNFYLDIIYHW